MSDRYGHIPVLLHEVLDALDPRPGEVYADCTTGLGGHALEIARRIGPSGCLMLNDWDMGNLKRAEERIRASLGADSPEIQSFCANFAGFPKRIASSGRLADMVLADLGFASNQMEDPQRGLSFSREGPLDMRLASQDGAAPKTPESSEPLPHSAADLVASLPISELERILREFGEERRAGAIARKIDEERRTHPISTTSDLASIVRSAVGRSDSAGIDPATKTFQAIRIAVNDELGNLDALLHSVEAAFVGTSRSQWLAPGARVGVISFHSLEDRPVKKMFSSLRDYGLAEDLLSGHVGPSVAEVEVNPRSRSAKLRAVRRR